jgi:PAS domain-containing protein
MIPKQVLDQISAKSTEGLALASAPYEDGAAVKLEWCNKAFTKITGYSPAEILGQKGSILIGPNMSQGHHLLIIEKLMNWEQFSANISS